MTSLWKKYLFFARNGLLKSIIQKACAIFWLKNINKMLTLSPERGS
jgi:hypothetical protein